MDFRKSGRTDDAINYPLSPEGAEIMARHNGTTVAEMAPEFHYASNAYMQAWMNELGARLARREPVKNGKGHWLTPGQNPIKQAWNKEKQMIPVLTDRPTFDNAAEFVKELNKARLQNRRKWITYCGTVEGCDVAIKTYDHTYLQILDVDNIRCGGAMDQNVGGWKQDIEGSIRRAVGRRAAASRMAAEMMELQG